MAKANLLNKANGILIFIFLSVGALYMTSSLLIPISFGGLVAMLVLPLARIIEKWKRCNRLLSTLLCFFAFLMVISGLFFAFYSQVGSFVDDAPMLEKRLYSKINQLQTYVEDLTGFSDEKQVGFLHEKSASIIKFAEAYISKVLSATTHILVDFSLFLVYFFFFLLYRSKIKGFILKLLDTENHETTRLVLNKIAQVTQQYLAGKLIVTCISAVLNSIGLLIIGVEHAIFFGVLAAFLNIIPYIGTFLGGLLPFTMTLITADTFTPALMVVIVLTAIHFLETNLLIPAIIGEKVNLNALATVMAVILGSLIWGIAGMVLFIPFLGILKIVFDHVNALNPYGYLIGNETDIEKPLQDTIPMKRTSTRENVQ